MTGFLPLWLACGGMAVCTVRTLHTVLAPTPVPWWLIPAAGLLVAGTLR